MSGDIYWVVSVPNEGASSAATFDRLRAECGAIADVHPFSVPLEQLQVGTLDSLMSLSDELAKVDVAIQKVVRFVVSKASTGTVAGGSSGTGGAGMAGAGGAGAVGELEDLQIYLNSRLKVPVEAFLAGRPPRARADAPVTWFEWNESKYPAKRPLPDLVKGIQHSVQKLNDDLRQLLASKDATEQKLARGGRQKGKYVLEDILTSQVVQEGDFVETEYLTTLVACVPSQYEQSWLDTYESLGEGIAGFGPEGDRRGTTGSPVVPGSSRKLVAKDDTVFFTVTLLKGQYQAGFYDDEEQFEAGTFTSFVDDFIKEAREKKFTVRPFTFDAAAAEAAQRQVEQWKYQRQQQLTAIRKFCSSQFGEAFVALTHIKAIRAFVESVLRYGLPPDFTTVLFKPFRNKEKKLHEILGKMYTKLQNSSLFGFDDEEEKDKEKIYPYIYIEFALNA